MLINISICIVLGALLWLDRVFIFQMLVSRPIALGAILGIITGDPATGLLVGGALELIWLNAPPVGTFLPYDESFCACVAIPLAQIAHPHMPAEAAAGLALVLCLPTALVGRSIDRMLRLKNDGLLPETAPVASSVLSRAMFKALVRAYAYALMAIGLCVAILGTLAYFLAGILPAAVQGALGFMPLMGIVIGLAGLFAEGRAQSKTLWSGAFLLGLAMLCLWIWVK